LRQAVQFMELEDARAELGRRRDRLLADKIDVARFVFELLEGTAFNER
jgi:hypothetical protein